MARRAGLIPMGYVLVHVEADDPIRLSFQKYFAQLKRLHLYICSKAALVSFFTRSCSAIVNQIVWKDESSVPSGADHYFCGKDQIFLLPNFAMGTSPHSSTG